MRAGLLATIVAVGLMATQADAAVMRVDITGTVSQLNDGNWPRASESYWNGTLAVGDAVHAVMVYDTARGVALRESAPGPTTRMVYGGTTYSPDLLNPYTSVTLALGGRNLDLTTTYAGGITGRDRGVWAADTSIRSYTNYTVKLNAPETHWQSLAFHLFDYVQNQADLPQHADEPYDMALAGEHAGGEREPDAVPVGHGQYIHYFQWPDSTMQYLTSVRFDLNHISVTRLDTQPAPVPLPASGLLLVAALGAMATRRRKG